MKNLPKNILLSRALSSHLIWWIIIDDLFLFLTLKILLTSYPFLSTFKLCLYSFITVFVCHHLFTKNFFKLLRYIITNNFNIMIFRKFSENHSFIIKQLIAPIFGTYGKIFSIDDKNLTESKYGISNASERVFGGDYKPQLDNNSWQNYVISCLMKSDCVVLYWPELPTKNMLWEYEVAKKYLSTERIIFILHDETAIAIKEKYDIKAYTILIDANEIFYSNAFKLKPKLREEIFVYMKYLKNTTESYKNYC